MTPEQKKAKEVFEKYLGIIGTNCEHNCYCDRPECNKLGYTFCHVDYQTAKACAIEEVKAVIDVLEWFGYSGVMYDHPTLGKCRINDNDPPETYWWIVLTEIQKL